MQIIALEKFQIQNLVMKLLCETLEVPAYWEINRKNLFLQKKISWNISDKYPPTLLS